MYRIKVEFENKISKDLILDLFKTCEDSFSKSFQINFLSQDGDKKLFEMKSNVHNDFYAAGLVGANIEIQIKNVKDSFVLS